MTDIASDFAIRVSNLSKCYQIYDTPRDRLKQFVLPRLYQLIGNQPKNYYRDFWALKDVSFEVKRGETLGIVGRNGSGKSTLLELICGTLTPSSGTVETNGRISALLELGSGFNPEFTGRENVFMNGAIHGLSKQNIEEKFDSIAAFADIGEFIDRPVKTYSSGMYARLAFAASMFVDPSILIVDEILAVGDAAFQAKCMRAFHKLRDEGCTIIIVAHDSYMIKNFCQNAVYLRKGEFIGFGESASIVNQYNLEMESALAQNFISEGVANIDPEEADKQQNANFEGFGVLQICSVELLNTEGRAVSVVHSGDTVTLNFKYRNITRESVKVTFVVNLYRHDGLYISGFTTLMDSYPPLNAGQSGDISVTFPGIRLLAGRYIWRVAINDDRAFGVLAEANRVCGFDVIDKLEAVGLFNHERSWSMTITE